MGAGSRRITAARAAYSGHGPRQATGVYPTPLVGVGVATATNAAPWPGRP